MATPPRADVLGTLLPGFVGTELPRWLDTLLREGLGGVCLFGQNISGREQLRALSSAILAANPAAVIAIDEEGGDVTRLYYDRGAPYPGNALLGRLADPELVRRTADAVGRQLREVGVNLDFAPDADINSNPDNPVIGVRSFGTEPDAVAARTAEWIAALQATGVAAAAKHFPGHGDTAQDSHLGLPVVDRSLDELRVRELVPFRAAIAAGAETIMTSHILLPQLDPENPATMSRVVLRGLLRGELGFGGVIVSDALDMKGASGELGIPAAAARALAAGVDLLCIGTENTAAQLDEIARAIEGAVASGALAADRVTDAAGRVRALAGRLAERRALLPTDATASREAAPAPEPATEPVYELDAIARGFDVSPHAASWIAAAHGQYEIVRIESVSNIAIGTAPWGPFAAGARSSVVVTPGVAGEAVATVTSDVPDASDAAVPGASAPGASAPVASAPVGASGDRLRRAEHGPVAVVGKDLHRRPYAREYIDRLRAEHGASVIVVDMGWPADDRDYADIATFGASRLLGAALLRLLGAGA